MSSEWPLLPIGEVSQLFDGPHATPKKTASGPIFLGISSLRRGQLDLNNTEHLSEEDFSKWTRRVTPQENDIVFSYETRIGEVAAIPEGLKCCLGRRMALLRPDRARLLPKFLLYYFLSDEFQSLLSARTIHGSTVDRLPLKDFPNYPIRVPPLDVQRAISATLQALDDRITLLRETNATLEAIAQVLFKSWFVDFDPVRAKQQGRTPEGMDEATAALFPDAFEESELGLVPKGWQVEWLSDVFDFKEGPGIRNWQYTNSVEGTRFINIRCIQDGDLSIETANRITDEEANGKYAHFHLKAWDVVVSTSGTLGRSAIVREQHLPLMLNTSVIRFRPVEGKTCFSFVYEYLNAPEFLFKLESMASGSVQKNFGPMHLKQIKLVCPPKDLIKAFEYVARPLFEKIVANRTQAQTLATLRDTLLPRLISGQLRLPEAEALIEEIA